MALSTFTQDYTWVLTSLDDPSIVLEGQLPPTNLVENVSGVWASEGTLGLVTPILQFVRGDLETISCDVKVFAKHQGVLGTGAGADEIKETVDIIRNLARVDEKLGRPHVWRFTVGEDFGQDVVIQSVGGIRYDRVRIDGTLRGVLFSLQMARYVEYNLAQLVGAAESLVVYVREGDYYESIAKRVLGDAELGEALRRRNPDRPNLVEGEQLHVPPAKILRRELSLTPQSLFLEESDRQRTNKLLAFSIRAESKTSHLVLSDFVS